MSKFYFIPPEGFILYGRAVQAKYNKELIVSEKLTYFMWKLRISGSIPHLRPRVETERLLL